MDLDVERLARAVAWCAVAIGVGDAVAPVAAGRFWGLAPSSAPVVPHLIRGYGVTLVGLGAATLQRGVDPVAMMRVARGVGVLTAVTGLLGGVRGRVSPRGAVMAVVTAGGLAALADTVVREG